MKEQNLPDNLDDATGALKVLLSRRVAELPLNAFEQLVGGCVKEYDKHEVIHYPASRIFKEMYFVWIAKDQCIQLTPSQNETN